MNEVPSGMPDESECPQNGFNLMVARRRHEIEIARCVQATGMDLDCRAARQDGRDAGGGQCVRHGRGDLFDGGRLVQRPHSALPVRRGRVRLRK